MQNDSLIFQIPNRKEAEPQPIFAEKTPEIAEKPLSLFEELNAISEEIEQCRQNLLA